MDEYMERILRDYNGAIDAHIPLSSEARATLVLACAVGRLRYTIAQGLDRLAKEVGSL